MKQQLSEDNMQTGQTEQVHKSPKGREQWCEKNSELT